MGIESEILEMLFITPEERGKELGRQLIQFGMEHYPMRKVTVNEQNPQAKGFYEHMGFSPTGRTVRQEVAGGAMVELEMLLQRKEA